MLPYPICPRCANLRTPPRPPPPTNPATSNKPRVCYPNPSAARRQTSAAPRARPRHQFRSTPNTQHAPVLHSFSDRGPRLTFHASRFPYLPFFPFLPSLRPPPLPLPILKSTSAIRLPLTPPQSPHPLVLQSRRPVVL